MHGEGSGRGSFAVEVAGGGEVVEGGFEGDFVVESVWGAVSMAWKGTVEVGGMFTLCSAVGLRGRGCSFHCRRGDPRVRWLRLFGGSCR